MADISADGLIPSGSFRPSFFSGVLDYNAGGSGALVTITPPAGKKVRLLLLVNASTNQSGMSVTKDGVAVVSNLTLESAAPSSVGQFVVGQFSFGSILYIEGLSQIVISKASGSASRFLYSYAYGD